MSRTPDTHLVEKRDDFAVVEEGRRPVGGGLGEVADERGGARAARRLAGHVAGRLWARGECARG